MAMKAGIDDYRPVGNRVMSLEEFNFSDELWAAFQLPVGLAFFFRSSGTGGVVALYPPPAGATESELHLESWEALAEANPILATLESDAEALVVNRMSEPHEHAIVPIDDCYRLVGLIKSTWTGDLGGHGHRGRGARVLRLRAQEVVRMSEQEPDEKPGPQGPELPPTPPRAPEGPPVPTNEIPVVTFEVLGASTSSTRRCRRCASSWACRRPADVRCTRSR